MRLEHPCSLVGAWAVSVCAESTAGCQVVVEKVAIVYRGYVRV